MDLLNSFKLFIKTENLFQQKDRLVIAVSGGVDSVVLCELCYRCAFDFTIAHCNFQLRGEESERDEEFVKNLAHRYNVEVLVKRFQTGEYALNNRLGIQEAARKLRYDWFSEIVNGELAMVNKEAATVHPEDFKEGAAADDPRSSIRNLKSAIRNSSSIPKSFLLTAHHANDNIETLVMNFFRGTGITGLRGILPKQGKVARPLLFATKAGIINFAEENNLPFSEDSSNASDKYTRNYFRNTLIPSIQKVYPQVEENLKNNVQRFKEIDVIYQRAIVELKKKLLEYRGEEVHIPLLKLLKTTPLFTLVYEIIKEFSFTSAQTDEVISLLSSETGKYVQSSSHKIIKNRNWLIIAPVNTTLAQNILIEEKDKTIDFAEGKLTIEKLPVANFKLSTASSVADLDFDEVTFPLLLRKWKTGDYFYPLGMNKKKKVNRFLIDKKLSIPEKEKTWVIEMNKKIIWIVGSRIDNRFKVLLETKNILRISLY